MESLIGGAYVQWGQSHSVMSGSSLVAELQEAEDRQTVRQTYRVKRLNPVKGSQHLT